MKDVLKAILTIWYLILGIAFLFLTMVSVGVLVGVIGGGNSAWWIGLFCTIVFWKASSIYRRKFLERVEDTKDKTERHWDDDDET
jgi:membrane protein implicated in regulation of membrane protease activity